MTAKKNDIHSVSSTGKTMKFKDYPIGSFFGYDGVLYLKESNSDAPDHTNAHDCLHGMNVRIDPETEIFETNL